MTRPKIDFERKFSVGNIVTIIMMMGSMLFFAAQSSSDIESNKTTNDKQDFRIEYNRKEIEEIRRVNAEIAVRLKNIEEKQIEMNADLKDLVRGKK